MRIGTILWTVGTCWEQKAQFSKNVGKHVPKCCPTDL